MMLPQSRFVLGTVCLAILITLALGAAGVALAQKNEAPAQETEGKASMTSRDRAVGYVAAAAVMCFSCLAAAYAVAKVGAAAMGACAEKPELMGRALIFVAIGEGIAVFGLIVAVLILRQL
ncbi:MAG: ATP synthase subunit C [Planctomycetota bacterium]